MSCLLFELQVWIFLIRLISPFCTPIYFSSCSPSSFPGTPSRIAPPSTGFFILLLPFFTPIPLILLQFNFLPPVYSTSSPSTRQGSTPSLTLLQSLCCPPPPHYSHNCKLFIWRSYWRIIHSAWQLHYMITTVKHIFINSLWVPPHRQQFS